MSEHLTTDPLDTPLPCNVGLPGMMIRKGVALRVLVNAATRWKRSADEAFAATHVDREAAAKLREALSHVR